MFYYKIWFLIDWLIDWLYRVLRCIGNISVIERWELIPRLEIMIEHIIIWAEWRKGYAYSETQINKHHINSSSMYNPWKHLNLQES